MTQSVRWVNKSSYSPQCAQYFALISVFKLFFCISFVNCNILEFLSLPQPLGPSVQYSDTWRVLPWYFLGDYVVLPLAWNYNNQPQTKLKINLLVKFKGPHLQSSDLLNTFTETKQSFCLEEFKRCQSVFLICQQIIWAKCLWWISHHQRNAQWQQADTSGPLYLSRAIALSQNPFGTLQTCAKQMKEEHLDSSRDSWCNSKWLNQRFSISNQIAHRKYNCSLNSFETDNTSCVVSFEGKMV